MSVRLQPIFDGMFVESNPIPVKYAMSKLGFGKNCLRLPLTPLSEAARAKLDPVLAQFGVE